MRDDRELNYASGEMSDAERLAYEETVTPEVQALKSAFASLRSLNEGIPDPQISFDRVRHAIEAAPAPAAAPWSRWFLWATPLAAMGALAIVMTRPQAPATQPVTEPVVVAKTDPVSPYTEPSIEGAQVKPAPRIQPDAVQAKQSKPDPEKQAGRRSYRRARPVLVAQNRMDFPRASEGLSKAAPAKAQDAPVIKNSPAVTEQVQPQAQPQEPVVVVSPTPNAQTGANAAMEVSKQTDDVLGG